MDKIPRYKKRGEPAKQRAFLAAYSQTGNITRAAEISKIDRKSHYHWLDDDNYRAAFNDAHEQACESLEQEARRRALTGVLEPVFYQGEKCGAIRRFSDTLLIFLLKGAMPEKYADRLNARIKRDGLGGIPDEELEAIATGRSRGTTEKAT